MIRLTVDGVQIPVDSEAKISLSYCAASLSDVESGRSAETVVIGVPSTPETDRLFGNAAETLTAERFNDTVHRAVLESQGARLLCGTATLAGAEQHGCKTLYRLRIKGDTALWARSAALRKVAAAGVKFTGLLTPEDICKGWSDDRAVKFFPVNRTERQLSNSSVSLMPAQTVMTPDDYWPFISVGAVVDAIFADAGYRIESRFMQSPLFRSLYMSGGYSAPDVASRKRTMDFLAGRTADAEAAADYFGRVYLTAAVQNNSVGNIVDSVEPIVTDDDGRTSATGFFTTNNRFGFDEETGLAEFRPANDVVVGFEYSIAYVTDYVIRSREELTGFNAIYFGNGVKIPFTLANRFVDNRDIPRAGYSYRVVIFDFDSSRRYRLTGQLNGSTVKLLDISSRATPLNIPLSSTGISNLRLLSAAAGSENFTECSDDWALYWGYVTESGRTEVEIKVRTPAETIAAGGVKRFSNLFIDGAQAGMKFTLLKRTTLRPVFASSAGYGSQLGFADVAVTDMRQSELLDALRQMFDLQFCTDETTKTVFIEPYADFFSGEIVDWSSRIDRGSQIEVSDPSLKLHERVTLGYAADDAFVTRFNNRTGSRFGRWSFDTPSQAALDGEKSDLNPLFSPTLSEDDKYFEARTAAIMQVRDTGESEENTADDNIVGNFSPRIVSYAGLAPLGANGMWGSPFNRPEYPLAAFHFPGDGLTPGFSLCFEDRDGVQGLHTFHDTRLEEASASAEVTLHLHIEPAEMAALRQCIEGMPSVRSRFRLDIDNRTAGALYTLRSIENYDPSKPTVKCTFAKIRPTA